MLTIEQIGTELKQARLQVNMTIDEVAEKSGLNRGDISRMENGKLNFTVNKLIRYLNACGTSLVFCKELKL